MIQRLRSTSPAQRSHECRGMRYHPQITGVIGGYPEEEIEDTLIQQIRYLNKLVDGLLKVEALEKTLRK